MKILRNFTRKADEKLGRYRWYGKLRHDYTSRTVAVAVRRAATTAGFAVYNAVFAALYRSLWYGAFAGYLFVLAGQRLLTLVVWRAASGRCADEKARMRAKTKIYLVNGAVFVPLTVALSVVISLLVTMQKPPVADEIMAIATAAYTTYKTAAAVRHFFKAKARRDPLVQTVRNIGIADALVSVILLESTLITTFGEMTPDMHALTAVTGLFLCAFTVGMGAYMIVTGAKRLSANEGQSKVT